MKEKFPYGYDVNAYIDKAFERMKKFRIALVMTLALLIASCGSKQNQADQTDAAESTDSTTVDYVDAVVAEQYDLEAIAKAIEGCES